MGSSIKFFKRDDENGNLFRDSAIVIFSVAVAVMLIKTGLLTNLVNNARNFKIFGGFLAGIFFTSIFTVAPATAVLGEIARNGSLVWTVISGCLGAMIGDLIIFRFVKNNLAHDFSVLLKRAAPKRLAAIFHFKRFKFFRWLLAFLGALLVASPLPDELGLAMMGLTKIKTAVFIPLSLILNSLGILLVGLIARSL